MNLLFLSLIVSLAVLACGTDSIRTSIRSQLQISPTNIKMDSEGKNTINNYILYARKNRAAKTAFDASAVNKNWIRNISKQKVKESFKINEGGLNIQNHIANKTILRKNVQMVLIRPKLRQCPEGTVRDSRGECALRFSDD
ncbi:uncharacterized protein LOC111031713 [Myzus persicae]|uniref:uncharacterized protein LOC111031713 n=1 Tax=Myzus persicae TaxID=13164 RepID=UPI000B931D9E|nr:uncharacterized protein LOC111031713 [Myzus persicae]